MLAAMCAVLGVFSIDIGTFMKISLVSLPIIIGAYVFGAIDGALIGGVGTFIYQLLSKGLDWSTPLWILPYIAAGIVAGLMAKRMKLNSKKLMTVNIITAVILVVCFAYRIQTNGMDAATGIWIGAIIVMAAVSGFISLKLGTNDEYKKLIVINTVTAIMITLVNTVCLIIYYHVLEIPKAVLFTSLPVKIFNSAVRAVLFTFIIPPLAKAIKKAVR